MKVPAGTLVGFWPVRPPVQLYVYGAVPPDGVTVMLPLLRPHAVAVALPLRLKPADVFTTAVAVPVQPVAVCVTVTV